jgi:hypothetical protein
MYLFTYTKYLKTTLDKGLVLAALLASSLFYLLVLFHYHAFPVTAGATDIYIYIYITVIGLTPVGSSTLHIYKQTILRMQKTEQTRQSKN